MAEMKDSGIEWIGEIPDDWKIFHFKYIVKEKIDNRGRTPEIDENDIGIPIIELDAIGNKNPDVEKASKFISEESYKKYIRKGLKSGDVLFGTVGSVGKCSIVPNEFNYCIAQNIVGYRFNNEQDSLFWYYYFKSEPFKHMYMQFNKGNIQNSIKISDMERGVLVIPPLKEQQFIANFLDKKCAEIDSLYTDIEKQIEILEEYKKSIITEAVTKGLDPDVEMKDSGIEWMGMVPSTWESNKVLNCIDFIGGSQPPLSYFEGEEKEGYVRLIQNRDYKTDDYMTFVPKRMVTKFCEVHDVMIGRYGPPLFVLHRGLKGAYNVAIMKAVPKLLDREFMAFYLQNYTLLQYIESFSKRTAGQAGVNTDILKKYPIYVPPMEEQKEIAVYLEKKCIEIDNVIGKKKEQLETLEQYKKSLIYEYVTGKKEVPDYE